MKISVVTICRNAENKIVDTMLSVLNQDYLNYEYIVVDGKSTDKTNEKIQEILPLFAEKGIPVTYISEQDSGISDAFNKGIRLSTGDYVGFVNAGDQLIHNALTVIFGAAAERHDIIYGNILWNDKENNLRYIRKSQADVKTIAIKMCVMHPACYIKKAAYDDVGLYDTKYRFSMDRELLARMYRAGKTFLYVDEELSIMESGGVSDSHENRKKQKVESQRIALENGITKGRFLRIYYKEMLKNFFKSMVKKRMGFVYKILKR